MELTTLGNEPCQRRLVEILIEQNNPRITQGATSCIFQFRRQLVGIEKIENKRLAATCARLLFMDRKRSLQERIPALPLVVLTHTIANLSVAYRQTLRRLGQ